MQYINPQTEAHYLAYFNQKCVFGDTLTIILQVCVICALWFSFDLTPGSKLAFAIFIGGSLAILYVIACHSAFYVNKREVLVVLMHVCGYIITSIYTPLPLTATRPTPKWADFNVVRKLGFCFRYSKTANLVFYSIVLPVRFKTHVCRALLATLIFASSSPFVCRLSIALGVFHPDDMHPLKPILFHTLDDPIAICTTGMVICQLVMGWIVTSVITYRMEVVQRRAFEPTAASSTNLELVFNLWPSNGTQVTLVEVTCYLGLLVGYQDLWNWLSSVAISEMPSRF